MKPALFSANSEGACPNCSGAGVVYTDLGVMATVATLCEVCEGRRFDASVLDYHFGGRDISEVLAMSVDDAEAFFAAVAADGDRTRVCGTAPLYAFLATLAGPRALAGASGRLLHYEVARDETTRSAVTYASVAFDAER